MSNLQYNKITKFNNHLNENDDTSDEERLSIRAELANMSFEELQKLKEKVGSKLYNKTVFKQSGKVKKNVNNKIKHKNKNYPLEISSKKPVPINNNIIPIKKFEPRDPRFDSLCGTFNKKHFKDNYKFLKNVREEEYKTLKEELKEANDQDQIKKLKYLIQRMENQNREERLLKEKGMKKKAEQDEYVAKLKSGEKPVFKKKSERRILDLVDHYEELKQKGKLKKHIEKQRKKHFQKERKKNPLLVS